MGELFPFLVSSSLLLSFSPMMFLSFPFLYALFAHWSKSAVFCCSFHGHSMCSFPHYSHVFVPCGGTCSFFSYPLPFSCPFLHFSPMTFLSFRFLSFSSMPCLPIDLILLYSAVVCMGILCVLFPFYSHVFVPCGGTCSFFSYPLPFSCPFLLRCSFPFVSFPFLLCLVCPLI